MEHQDADLAALLASNTHQHFMLVVSRYQHQLYSFALRLLGNPEEAEDVVQEAFTRAYTSLLIYAPARIRALRLRPWLYKITLNVFRQRVRTPPLHLVPLDLSEEGPLLTLADEELTQPDLLLEYREQVLERQQMLRHVETMVSKLPERYRIAITCYYFERLAYQEIADLLEQPLGTVKSNISRGIRLLRSMLETEREGHSWNSGQKQA